MVVVEREEEERAKAKDKELAQRDEVLSTESAE